MKSALFAAIAAVTLSAVALPVAADPYSFQFPTMTFSDEMTAPPACDPATATQTTPCPSTGR